MGIRPPRAVDLVRVPVGRAHPWTLADPDPKRCRWDEGEHLKYQVTEVVGLWKGEGTPPQVIVIVGGRLEIEMPGDGRVSPHHLYIEDRTSLHATMYSAGLQVEDAGFVLELHLKQVTTIQWNRMRARRLDQVK